MVNKLNRDANRRWGYSVWSRFVGLILISIFSIFTVTTAEDIWSHAILQALLIIGSAIFTIVIPDNIIFKEYLVKTSKLDAKKNK